ncbi:MAG: hypothetical protein ABWY00_12875 [Dongiaceae bacterium]
MTPQGHFMVTAPVRPDRLAALRSLLASMNTAPGVVDPTNRIVPFAQFPTIHVARFVVLDDPTLDDRRAYPDVVFPAEQILLAFLADCDGPGEQLLAQLAREAGDGLRRIFSHCEGWDESSDLLGWMSAHNVEPTTIYVNWAGRTVYQIREEARLHAALSRALAETGERDPQRLHEGLRAAVAARGVILTPPVAPTSAQKIAHILGFISVPVLAVVLSPLLIIIAPVFLLLLRRREHTDPVITPRPDLTGLREMSAREDHDVTNPFSAIGSLKPGKFRRYLTTVILWVVNWSTRYFYLRGRLARVGTIHFARWVLLDDSRRVFFASNYDGSLESYMDDFINKVAFGLNLVFSNGIGYPHTDFLVFGGAWREHEFKNFLRRHQVPTDVWYKAYPGLTTHDLARNGRIRTGFDRTDMNAEETRRWLAEI